METGSKLNLSLQAQEEEDKRSAIIDDKDDLEFFNNPRDNIDVYEADRRKSDSLRGATISVSSNPQYSLDENEEYQDKERFRITQDDKLIVASFKLPIEVYKDPKSAAWTIKSGPVNSFYSLRFYRVFCIRQCIVSERSSLYNYPGLGGVDTLSKTCPKQTLLRLLNCF